ncbi:uncharacterized protein BYT42DRAFT_571706 [Radiomyces spectabilis]|uniref:uncharacterized protein n=1 Tax=Radiomyces spectabilis TaxID=64574 RepID=UPI002220FE5C|nr:uncharacterized protein BYT42DRAFT_571706 [Radiomyces spectabilis]KAI8377790.1 hypothetical protein BYT42DRAFT_571706 [Radiomyces spectabilis]
MRQNCGRRHALMNNLFVVEKKSRFYTLRAVIVHTYDYLIFVPFISKNWTSYQSFTLMFNSLISICTIAVPCTGDKDMFFFGKSSISQIATLARICFYFVYF